MAAANNTHKNKTSFGVSTTTDTKEILDALSLKLNSSRSQVISQIIHAIKNNDKSFLTLITKYTK